MPRTSSTLNKGAKRTKRNLERLPTDVRRAQILIAAHEVIANEGYAKFTLRNIAGATGIHFATLQYHFRSKNELLSALIESQLQENRQELDDAVFTAKGTPRERFLAGIKVITGDNRKPKVIGFFLQLWGLANHDPMACKALIKFYNAYLGWMSDLVSMANPSLTAEQCRQRALPITSMLEGMLPTLLLDRKQRRPDPDVDEYLAEVAWSIATKP